MFRDAPMPAVPAVKRPLAGTSKRRRAWRFERFAIHAYHGVLGQETAIGTLTGATIMADDRDHLDELISSLKQQRDELAVQIHLGKAEAQEEWDEVTAKLDELTKDYDPLKDAMAETAGNVILCAEARGG